MPATGSDLIAVQRGATQYRATLADILAYVAENHGHAIGDVAGLTLALTALGDDIDAVAAALAAHIADAVAHGGGGGGLSHAQVLTRGLGC